MADEYVRKDQAKGKNNTSVLATQKAQEPDKVHVTDEDGANWEMPVERFNALYERVV
jgi:hypothetical protein